MGGGTEGITSLSNPQDQLSRSEESFREGELARRERKFIPCGFCLLLISFASVSQVPGSFAALTLANSGYLARFRLASSRKAGASAPRPENLRFSAKSEKIERYAYSVSLEWAVLQPLVEVRRVELLSEDPIVQASPSAACILDFPRPGARRQAQGLGSFMIPASPQSLGGPVPHINDAGC